jgi:pyruvate carboxylase
VALRRGCDAVHPGYGFLSENAGFARACEAAGLTFVGPSPEALALLGDKAQALSLAERQAVPILAGTRTAASLDEARSFLDGLGPGGAVMLKAMAGGGGRGMRPVTRVEDLAAALERCRSEAQAAFGDGDLYVETLLPDARHVEVQIVGDGTGAVVHLWDREGTDRLSLEGVFSAQNRDGQEQKGQQIQFGRIADNSLHRGKLRAARGLWL